MNMRYLMVFKKTNMYHIILDKLKGLDYLSNTFAKKAPLDI